LLQKVQLLAPLLQPLIDSLHQEVLPSKFAARPTEVIMAELLGTSDPDSVVAKRLALERKISRCQAMIASAGDDEDFVQQTVTNQALLETHQAALAKLDKGTPTASHDLKAYRKAKASYELNIQEKKDRQIVGAAKTRERRQLRSKFFEDAKAQLAILQDGIIRMDFDLDKAYHERTVDGNDHDAKVLRAFDEKITALELVPDAARLAPPQPPTLAITSVAAATAVPEERMTDGHIACLDELREARLKLEEAASRFNAEFEGIRFDADISLLPTPVPPTSVEVGVYGMMAVFFESWAVAGAAEPFDWKALACRQVPGPAAGTVVKTILGQTLWSKFYPDADPPLDGIISRQLALLILHAMRCIKLQFDSDQAEKEAKDHATQMLAEVRAQLKRPRTQ